MVRNRCALVLFCLAAWMVGFGGAKAPQILLRVYTQTDAQGSSNRAIPVRLTNPDDQIYVSSIPEATEKDLLAVEPAPGEQNTVGALLHFNAHAAMNLDASTTQYDGKILVVVVNGRVVYSPMIDTTISKGDLLIPRGLSAQEVGLLQAVAKENVREQKRGS